jgi:N-6 DNA Methylase
VPNANSKPLDDDLHGFDFLAEISMKVNENPDDDEYFYFCRKVLDDIGNKPPSRSKLVEITRKFNSKFAVFLVLIFEYEVSGDKFITLSVTQSHKRKTNTEGGDNIVEKVILLKDINLKNPHPAHTQILNDLQKVYQKDKTLNEIKEGYLDILSVENLNERFYSDLFQYFERFRNDSNDINYLKGLVRFFGRILFIKFLEKVSIFENKTLNINSFKQWLDKVKALNPDATYQQILDNLCFGTFNKNLAFRDYDNLTNISPLSKTKTIQHFDFLPYLNGGLFDKNNLVDTINLSDDEYYIKNLTNNDWKHAFGLSEAKKKTSSSWNTGIFNLFDKYNFSAEESDSEANIFGIDPEMLGRIMENLLASINENDSAQKSARKSDGAYYTPKNVVQMMCQKALAKYIKLEYTEHNADKIIAKIDKLRVLDPAVGSGAFPMGILNEISYILHKVDSSGNKWFEYQTRGLDSTYKKRLQLQDSQYIRKLYILKKCIYGCDINPIALDMCKLRCWLSLVTTSKVTKENERITLENLPNLDFKFWCADSVNRDTDYSLFSSNFLESLVDDFESFFEDTMDKKTHLEAIGKKTDDYFKQNTNFANYLCQNNQADFRLIRTILPVMFPEVFTKHKGFNMIIANPPYGVELQKADVLKTQYRLGSKDSYGIFLADSFGEILQDGGVICQIVSDTFLTIKSHRQLREQILGQTQIHEIVRVHPNTFDATVNTAIVLMTKQTPDLTQNIVVADLTSLPTRKPKNPRTYETYKDEKQFKKVYADLTPHSDRDYAVFEYPQGLVNSCSTKPFFVGSPKLFRFMDDTKTKLAGDKSVPTRNIEINGRTIQVCKFGDIAEIRQGLATGDNNSYLYQNPTARGNYKNINEYQEFLLTNDDLARITDTDEIRLKVIHNGIHKTKDEADFDPERYFGGRYIVPHDKGGEGNVSTGFLPNYFVPTDYYIDWSSWAVGRMKTLTIGERDGNSRTEKCAVIRSPDKYFQNGITLSHTGEYSPMFRVNVPNPFNVAGSSIFTEINISYTLGIICSKLIKYIFKNCINSTVNASEDPIKEIPFVLEQNTRIIELVEQIIAKQKLEPRYDYGSNEQKQIDALVYELYCLNDEDIKEVENWYARRYPRLVGV